ncbi:MAG TPA: hypothetical protein VKB88_11165 [Bryobacteraceae bacterium]|nr:hypothetical protein [Bryobacteraceae bacterium]
MSNRNAIRQTGCDLAPEEFEPRAACRLFEVTGTHAGVGAFDDRRQSQLIGKAAHEFGIGGGLVAAQAVIEVQDRKQDPEMRRQFAQGKQQANGIRTAGDGDTDLLAGREHAMAFDGAGDALQ